MASQGEREFGESEMGIQTSVPQGRVLSGEREGGKQGEAGRGLRLASVPFFREL